jgi:F1F0 ATPase subunit 2
VALRGGEQANNKEETMKIGFAVSLIVGMGIGAFYFIGLWWTVRRLPAVRIPALWTFGSFMVRTAACITVFYLAMQGRWENLLMCLAGFTLARLWLVRRLKPA